MSDQRIEWLITEEVLKTQSKVMEYRLGPVGVSHRLEYIDDDVRSPLTGQYLRSKSKYQKFSHFKLPSYHGQVAYLVCK